MRLLTISLALSIGSVLAFACIAEPDDDLESDQELRLGNADGGSDECKNDGDCAPGTVCEPSGPGCGANECVEGCHDDWDCESGESCTTVNCVTCPCPGYCEATGPKSCTSDDDCDPGTVCELEGPGCGPNSYCVAGCHDDADCNKGQSCNMVYCITCPCPGFCG
jgi:hypothetical protein